MPRRFKQTALTVLLAMTGASLSSAGAPANTSRYPQKAIHLIVPYPAGAVVAKLNQAVQTILRSAGIKHEISQEGGEAGATSPQQFANFITAERARWQSLVQESGVSRVGIAEAP